MKNAVLNAHTLSSKDCLQQLNSNPNGLSNKEAKKRLEKHGPNLLPSQSPPTLARIFLHQFLSPLIYILAIAALISIFLGDYSDAFFIALVLFINAFIGTFQEYSAEKSALALRKMAASLCVVEREGKVIEIDAENLVPGDIVILESGKKVPADLRLTQSYALDVDESLLTGESLTVIKDSSLVLDEKTALGDRKNMLFTGSLIAKGRAKGVVTATGLNTELGKIAHSISHGEHAKPPLVLRMESFTKKIAFSLILITLIMASFLLLKGEAWHDVMIFSVALAVAAIPEGLPVALTIALAIASRKMAKRNVIVRKLPAVEALGSCSFIATDKTGTLTVNQLTIKKIALPSIEAPLDIEGSGINPKGHILYDKDLSINIQKRLIHPLALSGMLCNEAQLIKKKEEWLGYGDAVDIAFLTLAHKSGLQPKDKESKYDLKEEIPFEPENLYAASLHRVDNKDWVSVKGALEKVLLMCNKMTSPNGEIALDKEAIIQQADEMAGAGYRVLALAKKEGEVSKLSLKEPLSELTFLGLVGMIDPLREEASDAIQACHDAGIDVAMVTGDHPKTAFAIAKEIGLASDEKEVVSGPQLKEAKSSIEKARLIEKAKVFARVEPQQKLEIVRHLLGSGRFVAVTGDGANDAPALKAANVGVAMGKSGTDIAKETSDLIITDDRFASIVAGVEEGRIAYNNIRKVVYLLISTGAAEILLFTLSLLFNTPLPLTAVQILWLNLVTNGIQDVGLAFEPGEGGELKRDPRKENEPVFNRLMIERIILSAAIMSFFSFFYFQQLIESGVSVDSARNLTLLLMVLFENVMVGNCRSETKSAFLLNPLNNKILLFGTLAAQGIHIAAMYTPGLREVLGVEPVSFNNWLQLLGMALSVFFAMEIYKFFRKELVIKKTRTQT